MEPLRRRSAVTGAGQRLLRLALDLRLTMRAQLGRGGCPEVGAARPCARAHAIPRCRYTQSSSNGRARPSPCSLKWAAVVPVWGNMPGAEQLPPWVPGGGERSQAVGAGGMGQAEGRAAQGQRAHPGEVPGPPAPSRLHSHFQHPQAPRFINTTEPRSDALSWDINAVYSRGGANGRSKK